MAHPEWGVRSVQGSSVEAEKPRHLADRPCRFQAVNVRHGTRGARIAGEQGLQFSRNRQNERIAAASVFLPLTKNPSISRELGTRHRAAIGVTEGSDAISIVVSEETGLITYVEAGEVRRNLDTTQLRKLLLDAMQIPLMQPKRETTKTMKEAESEITIG